MDLDIVIQWMFSKGAIETPIEVNSGVIPIKESGVTRFVSHNDWRFPTELEKKIIFAQRPCSIPEAITIVKFDQKIIEAFYNSSAAATCVPNGSVVSQTKRRKAIEEFTRKIEHELPSVGLKANAIRSADIQITPSNSQSTAYDYENNRYVGLHIDNHEKLSLFKRKEAFHVLVINFGNSERYFQFVNLEALKIAAKLNLHIENNYINYQKNIRKLTSNFFTTFPNYPVIKITLPPSYGYIAVTQSLIHDGATNHKGYADVAFLLSGNFSKLQ